MAEVICPYCLQPLAAKDITFVCPKCGKPASQSFMERLRGIAPICKDPACHGAVASHRKCAMCGADLPADILEYSHYLRFSMIGLTGSGKTNFLTTMIHELLHSPNTPWVIQAMNSNTKQLYEMNEHDLYKTHVPVAATAANSEPIPQQWRLRDISNPKSKNVPTSSLTIFDGAGESQENITDGMSNYIKASKALVILVDPMSFLDFRGQIDEDVYQWSHTADKRDEDSLYLISQVTDFIRRSCRMRTSARIDRNVAIVLTKIDAIWDLLGESATVTQPSPHLAARGFSLSDANAVNDEMRSFLLQYGGGSFYNALQANFNMDKLRFFGVSAFGQVPIGSNKLGKVIPHRVLDPLIWMLNQEGIVQTVK